MHLIRFRLGLLPRPPSWIKGPTSKGREEREREENGEGREREGLLIGEEGRESREREGRGRGAFR